jgi:uncharacterized OsmC-like protein
MPALATCCSDDIYQVVAQMSIDVTDVEVMWANPAGQL